MAVQEKFDLVIRAQDEATATLRNVNREVDRMGAISFPRLTSSMSGYTREAIKADLKSAALGSRLAGMSPAVSQLSNAFLIGNPIIAAAAFTVGVLTTELIEAIVTHEQAERAVSAHRSEIEKLANSNTRYAQTAREYLAISNKIIENDLSVAKGQLALAQNGLRAANFFERLIGLGPLVGASQNQITKATAEALGQIAKLEGQLDNLSAQMHGPTRDDLDRFIAQEKQAAKDAEMLNKALRAQSALLQGLAPENFRGTGSDTSLRGPGFFGVPQEDVDKAKEEARAAMESIFAIPEAERRAIQDAQDQWMEFKGLVLSSTDQLATGITDMFFGLRDSLADVFKSMAANWVRYFINEILKQTALKLGFALFNVIFPGSGGLLAGSGGLGAADIPVTPGLAKLTTGGSGLDIVSAGAKRFAGGGMSQASVNITIQGDVIGDEQYVNKRIIPAIENAIRYQKTIIASR